MRISNEIEDLLSRYLESQKGVNTAQNEAMQELGKMVLDLQARVIKLEKNLHGFEAVR